MAEDYTPPPVPMIGSDNERIEVPHAEAIQVAHLTLHKPVREAGAVQGMANMILTLLEERAALWEVVAGEYEADPVHAELHWPQRITRTLNDED